METVSRATNTSLNQWMVYDSNYNYARLEVLPAPTALNFAYWTNDSAAQNTSAKYTFYFEITPAQTILDASRVMLTTSNTDFWFIGGTCFPWGIGADLYPTLLLSEFSCSVINKTTVQIDIYKTLNASQTLHWMITVQNPGYLSSASVNAYIMYPYNNNLTEVYETVLPILVSSVVANSLNTKLQIGWGIDPLLMGSNTTFRIYRAWNGGAAWGANRKWYQSIRFLFQPTSALTLQIPYQIIVNLTDSTLTADIEVLPGSFYTNLWAFPGTDLAITIANGAIVIKNVLAPPT
jgi:hypothetical protein